MPKIYLFVLLFGILSKIECSTYGYGSSTSGYGANGYGISNSYGNGNSYGDTNGYGGSYGSGNGYGSSYGSSNSNGYGSSYGSTAYPSSTSVPYRSSTYGYGSLGSSDSSRYPYGSGYSSSTRYPLNSNYNSYSTSGSGNLYSSSATNGYNLQRYGEKYGAGYGTTGTSYGSTYGSSGLGYGSSGSGYGSSGSRYGSSGSGYGSSGSGYGSSGYGSTGYGSSGYGSTGYGSSGYGSTGYGSSGYGSTGYGSSGYGSTGYGSSGSTRYGSPGYGSSSYGSPGYGSTGYGTSGLSGYGTTGYGSSYGSGGYGSSGVRTGYGNGMPTGSYGSYGSGLRTGGSYGSGSYGSLGGYTSYEAPFMRDMGSCVNRSPQTDVFVESIMGMWYGVEVIEHFGLDVRRDYQYEQTCIVIHLSEPLDRPSTENQLFHVAALNAKFRQTHRHLRLLWDENGHTIEYPLFFRNESAGYWHVLDGQNGTLTQRSNFQQFTGTVQVLTATHDHLVLNFCQEAVGVRPAQLYSVLFSRNPGELSLWELDSVHAMLQNKKLSIASRRMVCGNNGAERALQSILLSVIACMLAYVVGSS